MKRLIALFVTLLFITGCMSSVSYNVKTGEVKYFRMGDQKLNGVTVEIDPNNGKVTSVKLESQESKGDFGPNILAFYQGLFDMGFKAGSAGVK
jgi:major membrane immunogen (membrane-anchored lipoprotein)